MLQYLIVILLHCCSTYKNHTYTRTYFDDLQQTKNCQNYASLTLGICERLSDFILSCVFDGSEWMSAGVRSLFTGFDIFMLTLSVSIFCSFVFQIDYHWIECCTYYLFVYRANNYFFVGAADIFGILEFFVCYFQLTQ